MHRQLALSHFPSACQHLCMHLKVIKLLSLNKCFKSSINYVSPERIGVLDHVAIRKYGYKIMSSERVDYRLVLKASVYKVMQIVGTFS